MNKSNITMSDMYINRIIKTVNNVYEMSKEIYNNNHDDKNFEKVFNFIDLHVASTFKIPLRWIRKNSRYRLDRRYEWMGTWCTDDAIVHHDMQSFKDGDVYNFTHNSLILEFSVKCDCIFRDEPLNFSGSRQYIFSVPCYPKIIKFLSKVSTDKTFCNGIFDRKVRVIYMADFKG